MSSSERFTGKQYHIGAGPGDLARYILLCGDPARARKVAKLFDPESIRFHAHHREFVTYTGKYRKAPVTVMSTGVGMDNTEIAVIESSRCFRVGKPPTFIRIGSCGAIRDGIKLGDLIISKAAVQRGMDSFRLPRRVAAQPVKGSHLVFRALDVASVRVGAPVRVGVTCSATSFYGGQCRDSEDFPILPEARAEVVFPRLARIGVLNFEMEMWELFVLAKTSPLGIRVGGVCAVYAERNAGKGFDKKTIQLGERRCIQVGLEAVWSLHYYDRREKG